MKKHTRADGRHIGVAEKFPHVARCGACWMKKLCTKCGASLIGVNCTCSATEQQMFKVCSLTPHQLGTLVSVAEPRRDTSFQGVHETRDETIAYEKGCGWWAGYTGLDGQTAHALIRAGMITIDNSITNSVTEYYKLTRLGELAVAKDHEYRKELGVL